MINVKYFSVLKLIHLQTFTFTLCSRNSKVLMTKIIKMAVKNNLSDEWQVKNI